MASETAPSDDPFLSWVHDALADERDHPAELSRLRQLAEDIDKDMAPLALSPSSDATEVRAGSFVRVKEMDPRWLERWLTFDPESETGVSTHSRRPHGNNAALIDHTTINLVAAYIGHQVPPSPLGVLDLANFVNNVVLRDTLVALNHRLGTRQVGRDVRDEICPLGPWEVAVQGGALLWIRRLAQADPDSDLERMETTRTWSTILGRGAPSAKEMFDVPFEDALLYINALAHTDEYGNPSDNLTPFRINELFERPARLSKGERTAAVQATNCRALLNLEAARHYNIPYAGGITRLPIKRLAWRRGRQGDASLAAIEKPDIRTVDILDRAYRQAVTDALAANQRTVVLPVFLAAVLARIDRLSQFYEALDDMRTQAEPLRKRLVAIEEALDDRQPQYETRKLLAAFDDESQLLRRTVWDLTPAASAVLGVVLTAATGQPLWLTATLAGLKAHGSMQRQTWDRLANRVWRRDLWFVTGLGQVSSELINATPRLEQLWGRHFEPSQFGARLESLRALETL